MDLLTLMPLASLMVISFAIAYGLWKLKKWAWALSFSLSVFGIVSGLAVSFMVGFTESILFQNVPRLLIDLLVVFLLLTKDVRRAFRI